ncbi:hypothetical protein ACI4BF_28445, partial [Klebsiella pneumoniae]|uniref:hypothetical protein n=1 Tax=Klebsiella pneumoniae TaxID=573 RepID=UPI003854E18A
MIDKLLPKEVKSRTASAQNEGITSVEINEIQTKRSLFNSIVVGLGGLTAEKLIFGEENQMVGSVGDLQQVTSLASKMV